MKAVIFTLVVVALAASIVSIVLYSRNGDLENDVTSLELTLAVQGDFKALKKKSDSDKGLESLLEKLDSLLLPRKVEKAVVDAYLAVRDHCKKNPNKECITNINYSLKRGWRSSF